MIRPGTQWLSLLVLLSQLAAACAFAADDDTLKHTIQVYRSDGAESTLAEFERLAEAFGAQGNEILQLRARRYVAECYWRLGEFDRSRVELAGAMVQAEALGEQRELGDLNNVLGLLNWDSGRFDEALHAFRRTREIALALGDPKLQAMALNNSGLVLDELGHHADALAQYETARSIYVPLGFERGLGDTLGNLGGTYLLLGQYGRAFEFYREALKISEQLGSSTALSQDHGNLALCLLGMGRITEALHHFDQAISFAEQAGMPLDVAYWTASKGSALMDSGRYDLGLAHYREAIEEYQRIGARAELVESRQALGQLLATLGDDIAAEAEFAVALRDSRDMSYDRGITMSLMSLGMISAHRGQWADAAQRYEQAVQRSKVSGQQSTLARGLLELARVRQQQEQFDRAHRLIERAAAVARKNTARPLIAEAHYLSAENHRLQRHPLKALESYDAAVANAGGSDFPELQWRVQHGRARALESAGDLEQAVAALQSAVNIIESVRNRLLESRYRSGYIQDKYEVYVELVRLQLELGHREQAFETAERLRSRTFSRLAQPARDRQLTAADQAYRHELRERIRHLQRLLDEEQMQNVPLQRQAAIDTYSNELMQAEKAYLAFIDDRGMLADFAAYEADLPGSKAVGDRLQPDEALVEYLLTSEQVLIFFIRPDGLQTLSHAVSRKNLETRIGLLRDLVQQPGHNRWLDPAGSLAESLVQPLVGRGWLKGVQKLYVVPHDVLNYLPFSLLPMPGQESLIVQSLDLAYLPSARMLAKANYKPGPGSQLLSLAPGRSGLVHAAEEARSVGALFEPEARLLMGSEATESRFKSLAGGYRFLHLATHGYFDRVNPLFSWLELEPDASNDGQLEVHEILELQLDAQLITLSACQTAMAGGLVADLPAGDEFVGLTRAFLSSGGQSVLATLWEVDDRSSVQLMQHFYRALARDPAGFHHATLLTKAQRQLLLHSETQHPYYWAPFVLVGDAAQARPSKNSDSEI